MERQYTRIDFVREILDKDLKAIADEEITYTTKKKIMRRNQQCVPEKF